MPSISGLKLTRVRAQPVELKTTNYLSHHQVFIRSLDEGPVTNTPLVCRYRYGVNYS